jgi:hypothetical protein
MPRLPRWVRSLPPALLTIVFTVAVAGCGQDSDSRPDADAGRALKACRAQWHEVGDSVLGMDQDANPSSLAERWTSVIATVDYYQTTDSADGCQANVETQLKAVTSLRQFSEKLRPYDMTYQLSQVQAAVDLYLHDPLPDPVRGESGKKVQPPSKAEVTSAMETLTANAAQANTELAPAWGQAASVDLSDVSALTTTMQDLDQLAQDSPHWVSCEQALQGRVAAIRAQEGLSGSASVTPSAGPTDATTPAG